MYFLEDPKLKKIKIEESIFLFDPPLRDWGPRVYILNIGVFSV